MSYLTRVMLHTRILWWAKARCLPVLLLRANPQPPAIRHAAAVTCAAAAAALHLQVPCAPLAWPLRLHLQLWLPWAQVW